MTTDINEFISNIKNKTDLFNKDTIFSFAEKIDITEIPLVLNNLEDYFYWKSSEFEIEFIAYNPLIKFDSKDFDTPEKLENTILSYKNNRKHNFEYFKNLKIPVFVGAIKFEFGKSSSKWNDFSNETWFIPKFMILKNNTGVYLITNFNLSIIDNVANEINYTKQLLSKKNNFSSYISTIITINKSSENFKWWESSINTILNNINNGNLQKVVISREIEVRLNNKPIISDLLNTLDERFPECFKFAYSQNNSIFFGASPEKILTLKSNILKTDALAGSMPRHIDKNKDLEYEKQLSQNPKDLNEHNTVVKYITDVLTTYSKNIKYLSKPEIKKLRNIQHLYTPIEAVLDNGYFILEILRAIHPTPAICGFPCNKAKDLINNLELHDRGLFTGAIGWANFDNEGEFSVAIRSALLKEKQLYVYAGCGIVPGSNPELEYKETNLKFNSILNLFNKDEI